ncbi:BON domain-containing protein [Rhizobium sp. 32-5/1]|uniref:BON domain-containing protein n=1 Tax=Rhizobium sp. 32-5/1 TaxID=3019602 RepID=UPI00240E7804|nr:BON domain-containing protein [Rhizobium sp. 32-5/1]WEZ84316.1 BON domain-containing protein [Rhizobium sp. 32-5/1]
MTEKNGKPTSREEDYRDYEERDLKDGWPYADAVAGSDTTVQNQSYGDTAQNFDESGNPGFETSSEAAIQSASGADLLGERTDDEINDDSIEEAISERLENSDIETAGMDIKVSAGVVHLTGFVETAGHRRQVEKLIYAEPGVTGIRNDLTLTAADANIPADWDE